MIHPICFGRGSLTSLWFDDEVIVHSLASRLEGLVALGSEGI